MSLLYFTKCLKRIILLIMIILCVQQESYCQNNTVKFTPIKVLFEKTNFSYERKLSKDQSIIADIQLWFLNKKERKREAIFDSDNNTIFESNDGFRLSLEYRKYKKVLETEINTINFYIGAGLFGGMHDIRMKRNQYELTRIGGGLVPEITGEINLISSGILVNWGVQFALGKVLKIELGMNTGKAWVNQKNDFLVLNSTGFYLLQEERIKYEQNYSNRIAGFFAEPMLIMGFSF